MLAAPSAFGVRSIHKPDSRLLANAILNVFPTIPTSIASEQSEKDVALTLKVQTGSREDKKAPSPQEYWAWRSSVMAGLVIEDMSKLAHTRPARLRVEKEEQRSGAKMPQPQRGWGI